MQPISACCDSEDLSKYGNNIFLNIFLFCPIFKIKNIPSNVFYIFKCRNIKPPWRDDKWGSFVGTFKKRKKGLLLFSYTFLRRNCNLIGLVGPFVLQNLTGKWVEAPVKASLFQIEPCQKNTAELWKEQRRWHCRLRLINQCDSMNPIFILWYSNISSESIISRFVKKRFPISASEWVWSVLISSADIFSLSQDDKEAPPQPPQFLQIPKEGLCYLNILLVSKSERIIEILQCSVELRTTFAYLFSCHIYLSRSSEEIN